MESARAIEVDDPATWPAWLRDDLAGRPDPPSAPEASAIRVRLADESIRLYHATRLTAAEVAYIRAKGLRRSSRALVRAKAVQAAKQGALDPSSLRRVATHHRAHEDKRRGVVWFCPARQPVRDHEGLRLFFGHWGGQAVWLAFDELERVALAAVGRPSLVVARIPVALLSVVAQPGDPTPTPWDYVRPEARLATALWQQAHLADPPPFLITVRGHVPAAHIEDVLCAETEAIGLDHDPFGWPSSLGEEPSPLDRLHTTLATASMLVRRWDAAPRHHAAHGVDDRCCG